MKTKLFTLLFALLSASGAFARDYERVQIGDLYYNLDATTRTAEVTYDIFSWDGDSYASLSGAVVIPSSVTYNNIQYNVTRIGDRAFDGCTGLTAITIPESVTSIGEIAFRGCTGLTSITIPESVTSIGKFAFSGCTGLTSITVAAGNTVYDSRNNCNAIIETATNKLIQGCNGTVIPNSVTSIETDAFSGSGLTSITIPESVTSIGACAFEDCTGLTSITILEGVTSIGACAFSGCTGLTSITIPESVTSIEGWAFEDCTGLTSITIPESVMSIGDRAFDGCTGLTSIVWNARNYSDDNAYSVFNQIAPQIVSFTFGNHVETIPSDLCREMSKLTSITIPESVTSIRSSAFNGCIGLTSITIPESVTSIGDGAFYGCTGLTSITIPESVTSIGYDAFEGCTGLTAITWNVRNYSYTDVFNQIAPQIVSFTFGSNVETIPGGLCSGMSKLTSITIPEGVTSIGSAFYGCTGLTSITIPESVTSIGYDAFDGCTGLTSIVWNARNYSDDYADAFNQIAPQIVSFTFGNHVETIPGSLCRGMSKLTSITIPESVTSIGNGAFAACSGLTSITIAADNTVYDSHDNCNAIIETATNKLIAGCKNTVIPNSVTSIEYSAFRECLGLTSITIPNSVTYIGESAFEGCTDLTSITIPNSVTYIGEYAFYGCTDLTSVTLGSSLKVIEYGGFASCENLQTITCYSQRPPTVQEGGLEDVPYSTIIYVPADYLDTYKQHVTWGSYDVRPIDGSAVENVTSVLGSMTLTDGVLTLSEPLYMEIYTVSGASVFCGTASSVSLPTPGIYLLRSQGVTQKITVH